MPKIAIDVVLLPPENIMDKAIEINKQFADDPIELNKENCLPHISLCMGVLEDKNLPKIKELVSEIGSKFSKLPLKINKINEKYSTFDIEKTEALQKLHEEIMVKLGKYLSYNATIDMCFSPPAVVEKTLFWINTYKEKSILKIFTPIYH